MTFYIGFAHYSIPFNAAAEIFQNDDDNVFYVATLYRMEFIIGFEGIKPFTLCPCHLEDSTFSFKGQHSNHYLMFCSMFKCQRALRVIKYFMNGKAHKVEVIMFMAMTRCKQDLENRKSNFIYAPNSASSLYLKHVCLRRHFRDFHLLRKLIAAIKVQLVSSPCDKLC